MRILVVSAAVAAVMPLPATAQAFGVRMGDPVSQYSGSLSGADSPFHFSITVPTPNNEFEAYVAVATPQTGICKVSGLGKNHDGDDFGTTTMSSFRSLGSALTTRYGKPEAFDFLDSDAVWKKPDEWNWAVFKKERQIASYWLASNAETNLPGGLEAVTLEVESLRRNNAYIVLTYEFSNFERCLAVMDSVNARGL